MFEHEWLGGVQRAPGSDDIWDVESDGYGDAESGHGTFIAGLILQVAPAASVYAAKVLDSHGVGDDLSVAKAMAALPADIDIINLSLGGYTDRDAPPLAIATAMQLMGQQRRVVVAAAGNHGLEPSVLARRVRLRCWPSAPSTTTAASGRRACYSNYGPWVDASPAARTCSPRSRAAKTKVAQGADDQPHRPDDHLRRLGRVGRHLVRHADRRRDDRPHDVALSASARPRTPRRCCRRPRRPRRPDFPNAVLLDELEGAGGVTPK